MHVRACAPDLVGGFPRVVALGIHDPKVHGGVRTPQEVGLFPQLHRPLVVPLKLLVVPGQGVGRGYETLSKWERIRDTLNCVSFFF